MKRHGFTGLIVAVVILALIWPDWFQSWNGFELKRLIIPILQIIMLGMGTTIGWHDFEGVLRMPRAVCIGLACQFTIMPLLGFALFLPAYRFCTDLDQFNEGLVAWMTEYNWDRPHQSLYYKTPMEVALASPNPMPRFYDWPQEG